MHELKRKLVNLGDGYEAFVTYGKEAVEKENVITFYPELPNNTIERHTFNTDTGVIINCMGNQEYKIKNMEGKRDLTDDEVFDYISSFMSHYIYPIDFWFSNGYDPAEYMPN